MGASLKEAGVNTDDLAGSSEKLTTEIEELKTEQEAVAESATKFGTEASEAFELAGQAIVAVGLAKGLKEIAGFFANCAQASIEYESAMAGVAKTTDMTDDELAAMGDELQKLSTQMPVAATELAEIDEAAGQLGIAKNDITEFTVVMANLGVATNLSATEAAESLAKFANVMGTSSSDYEKLGSVIVALGKQYCPTAGKLAV